MHIYQPFDLFLGTVMILLGVPGLARDLYRAGTRAFRATYTDWRSLGLSLWFSGDGPAHISRAFDPAHQESHRTAVLVSFALPAMGVAVLAGGIAWWCEWRRKRPGQVVAGAEHSAA